MLRWSWWRCIRPAVCQISDHATQMCIITNWVASSAQLHVCSWLLLCCYNSYSATLLELIRSMLSVDPLSRPDISDVINRLHQLLSESHDSQVCWLCVVFTLMMWILKLQCDHVHSCCTVHMNCCWVEPVVHHIIIYALHWAINYCV